MIIKKTDKIYLAGHTGLVGKAVFKKLKEKGFKKIIVRKKTQLDLKNQKKTFEFLNKIKPKIVIICAAKVGGIKANNNKRADFLIDNLEIQNNLIHGSFKNKVKNLIFLGSSCVYPSNISKPINEEMLLKGPLEKTNEPYAIAKIAGIKLCQSFNKQYKTNYRCLMPCNIFGLSDNYNLDSSHFIPAILKKFFLASKNNKIVKLWGTGNVLREVMYADDLADAIVFFMNKKTNHMIINIGTNIEKTIKNFTKNIINILKLKIKVKFNNDKRLNGVVRKKLDLSLAKKYGWKYKTSFDDAIRFTYNDLIANYKKQKH
jgi:GDP-L-fucose synthase